MKSQELKRQHWQFDFYSQWHFRKMNWYDFTIVELSVEVSPYTDSAEVRFGLLGCNFTVTYRRSFDFLDEMDDLANQVVARLEDEHPGKTVEDPFNELEKLK